MSEIPEINALIEKTLRETMSSGVKLGMSMAIAMARDGSLRLSPGPSDDPTAYPYSVPLHHRAEAYIASQMEERAESDPFLP